jgi:pimeloyl-ACP methyl ester carboxylesterase
MKQTALHGGRPRPLLVLLHGESDPIIEPASSVKFAAAIPGARLITYPQVDHLPQIEIPLRSAADVAAFLETQPARP